MTKGKYERLTEILEGLVGESNGRFESCVVTNERGLIVTGKSVKGTSHTLAAMVSLLSDTASRINENLGFGHPKISSIKSFGVVLSTLEFMVLKKWFRIGAVHIETKRRRLAFFRKKLTSASVDEHLEQAAERIRLVLEDKMS
ncbi:MAG: hypothetical protein ACW987_00685 [Candidatus Thorarchaeota archaeon]|jgi:predicted regulator of Ras-like GTPase activity (Roadblock/LC7/MglB family)